MPKQSETTVKRWIELPPWLADKIAVMAQKEHRTEKGQIEYLLAKHVQELEQAQVLAARSTKQ